MLRLSLSGIEKWDPEKEEFIIEEGEVLELEHSLYTVSSWEAKWKKAFANREGLTREELLDYIMHHMCQTSDVSPKTWLKLTGQNIKQINDYIEDPACATTIHSLAKGKPGRKETVTAELIYFYMTQFGIPFECEHWHLNKLMKLIDVCAIKNSPGKKMNQRDVLKMQSALNEKRKAQYNSRG